MQFGEYFTTCSVTCCMILKFTFRRSSRLMPGLRGTPDVIDDDVGVGALGVVAGAQDPCVRAPDRTRFEHVERNARRFLVGDVDDHHVCQLFVGDASRHGGAHVPRTANDRHFSIHELKSPEGRTIYLGQLPDAVGRFTQILWKSLWKRERLYIAVTIIWNVLANCTTQGTRRPRYSV